MVATATPLSRPEVEKLVREVLTQRLRGRVTPPPAQERHAAMPSRPGGPPNPLVVNVSARHVHMNEQDMGHFGVKDGDEMRLRIDGPCGLTFDRVRVRYHPKVVLEVHIDTDEGNACDLDSATHMELFK